MPFTTQIGVADLDSFAEAIVLFAVQNAGFTNQGSVTVNGSDTMYRISKTVGTITTYWWFTEATVGGTLWANNIVQSRMMHILPTESNRFDVNRGQRITTNMGAFDLVGPFTGYSLFTDGLGVFAVLEVRVGIFAHIALGHMEKTVPFDGGAYLTANNGQRSGATWFPLQGSNSSSLPVIFGARANSSNSTNGASYIQMNRGGNNVLDFMKLGSTDSSPQATRVASGTMSPGNTTNLPVQVTSTTLAWSIWQNLQAASSNLATLRSPIMPIFFVMQKELGSTEVQLIGRVPNIGTLTITSLTDKELVNTDWRTFPLVQRGTNPQATRSSQYGVAYREIP